METDLRRELLTEYLDATGEFLDTLDQRLLRLEQTGEAEPELLTEILGLLHTFKGNSGLMGYDSFQKFAHRFEDLWKAVQAGEVLLDNEVVARSLDCASSLRECVSALEDDPDSPDPLADEMGILDMILATARSGGSTRPGAGRGGNGHHGRATLDAAVARSNILKVDFLRLDHLLNLMGELVIRRTRLGQIETQFKKAYGVKGLVRDFSDAFAQMGQITTELHEAIMKVRMLPAGQVFMRFPRLVRDLARELGKDVELIIEGEDTELDKTVVDALAEPLVHLVRNAVDHGIEDPAIREARGKSRRGAVALRARQESSSIIITIEDDGAGLDENRLREKARELGYEDRAEAGRRELLDLIFLPGFTTAGQVTEYSGRGVGMDVVKKSLARVGGVIEVESERGCGTVFTIKLPLTLAIISALMVRVGSEKYAVPLSSIEETIKVAGSEIHRVNGREVITVRDRTLPLVRLADFYEAPGAASSGQTYVVIVNSAYGRAGLAVDSLLGGQEVVIKSLDEYLGEAPGVAGATILGDGKVVLIVDVIDLVERLRLDRSGLRSVAL